MGMLANISHHIQVAKASLNAEKEAPKQEKMQAHELQFMPATLEVMETPASPLGRTMTITIAAFFTIATLWAVFGEVDIIATSQGKIIPSARVKVIQPLENGAILAIHVDDGQRVKKGDVLIEFKPTGALADVDRLSKEYLASQVETSRLVALLEENPEQAFKPPVGATKELVELHHIFMVSQWLEHQSKQAALKSDLVRRWAEANTTQAEINRLETILPMIRERVDSRKSLVAKKYAARIDLLELQERLLEQEGQLAVELRRFEEAEASTAAAESQLKQSEAEFRRTILSQLTEAHQRGDSLEQELIKAEERKSQMTLVAPVDGVVQQLAVHTVGGVVTAAQQLMVVVPANTPLEVEARVLNKDIGFVQEGQIAEIKVDSFPFTKYGIIDGKVITVSKDAVENEKEGLIYPARVAMARTTMLVGKKWVNLSPGMSITLEIKTGKRKLIEYLLAPLQEYQSEAMRER